MYKFSNLSNNVKDYRICNNRIYKIIEYRYLQQEELCYDYNKINFYSCNDNIFYILVSSSKIIKHEDENENLVYENKLRPISAFIMFSPVHYIILFRDRGMLIVLNEHEQYEIRNMGISYIQGKLIIDYTTDNNISKLTAFNIYQPEHSWIYTLPENQDLCRFIVNEHGVLVFSTYDDELYALDANTGALLWKVDEFTHYYHYKSNDKSLLGIRGHELQVVDLISGNIKWYINMEQEFNKYKLHLLPLSGHLVDKIYYFVCNDNPLLFGHLDITSGKILHIQSLEGPGDPLVQLRPPLVHNHKLYLLASTDVLYEFDITADIN